MRQKLLRFTYYTQGFTPGYYGFAPMGLLIRYRNMLLFYPFILSKILNISILLSTIQHPFRFTLSVLIKLPIPLSYGEGEEIIAPNENDNSFKGDEE